MAGKQEMSNNTLMARMSLEGWIGLCVVLVGMIGSYYAQANATENNKNQIAENKETIEKVEADVADIKTDVAIIKNEQQHINQIILDIQREQREDLEEIKRLLQP